MSLNIFALIKKELKLMFISPVAYISIVAFLAINAVKLLVVDEFFVVNVASLRNYFEMVPVLYIVLIPALTMRIWSEEKKTGTDEILYTLPYTEWELVLGKFIASFLLLLIIYLLTLPLPISVGFFGDFEWGQIWGEYIGALLLGAAALSVGLFISSLTSSQFSAFIVTTVFMLFLTTTNLFAASMNFPEQMVVFLNNFSLDFHFEGFKNGIVHTRDLIFFSGVTFIFLFMNTRVIIWKKWK